MIPNARQIFDATSSDKHDRVLLQVVPDTRNIRGHFDAIREPHARYFSQR